jgi:Glycosyltransferase family 87
MEVRREPISAAAFWLAAGLITALRLWLAVNAKVFLEIEQYWPPIARAASVGEISWEGRYHFFPLWGWILALLDRTAQAGPSFAALERGFLTAVDVGIAAIVYRLSARVPRSISPRAAALLYLCNPVAIFVSSVLGQFDGLALLFLAAAVLQTVSPHPPRRTLWAAVLLGLSIAAKQFTALHPLLWLRQRGGGATVVAAYVVPFLTLLPYAASWRTIARSLVAYYSTPLSYGLSELVLYDARYALVVGALGLAAALATISWLRGRDLARSCLFLFLVVLFFAPGLGAQYLLWPLPFGAVFGGWPMILFTLATMVWVVGSYFDVPGSGQFFGHLVWITVGVWMFFESRALQSRPVPQAE